MSLCDSVAHPFTFQTLPTTQLNAIRPYFDHLKNDCASQGAREHLRQGDIPDLNILVTPLVEELHGSHLRESFLGQGVVDPGGDFDLDFTVFRHFGSVAPVVEGRIREGCRTVSVV